jgi:hypothetical protein
MDLDRLYKTTILETYDCQALARFARTMMGFVEEDKVECGEAVEEYQRFMSDLTAREENSNDA